MPCAWPCCGGGCAPREVPVLLLLLLLLVLVVLVVLAVLVVLVLVLTVVAVVAVVIVALDRMVAHLFRNESLKDREI